uniref:Uncharacterized protein n=1 Tax=Neogobius melanostomus TaxID=47308 RepID=A0A8C6U1M6_9GOBI
MAQISQPRGAPVGKEEALRMEEEALAKLQRDKRQSFPSTASKPTRSNTIPAVLQGAPAQTRDLIVFPETKKPPPEPFKGIDVDKLTNEELEKLLLDDNFTTGRPETRPVKPALLGSDMFNLLNKPSLLGSDMFNTLRQHSVSTFPTAPFPKAGTFQNGFPPFIPKVDPEMVKLFDKIASTKEYLKNGRASGEAEPAASLEPKQNPTEPAAPANMGRFDWLDLDPLTKRKEELQEEAGPSEGDPWDAVLKERDSGSSGDKDQNDGGDSEGRTTGRSPVKRVTTTAVTHLATSQLSLPSSIY